MTAGPLNPMRLAPGNAPTYHMERLRAESYPPSLPAWPFVATFGGFALWWVIGIADAIWIFGAVPMLCYLIRERARIVIPSAFTIWILFILWMLASVIMIDSPTRLLGFALRAGIYIGSSIIFLYVYNARHTLTTSRVVGVLAVYWTTAIAGGFLGMAKPYGNLHTLMSYVVPRSLQSNDFVLQMVRPQFAQGNPDGYFQFAPRPSAPFDYTNTWGTSFSLLIPFVFICLSHLHRRSTTFWLVLLLLPVSLIPAFATQNRGMLLGIGVGFAYAAVRFATRGHGKAILALSAFAGLVFLLTRVLGVQSQINARVSTGASNDTRLAVYSETFARTLESPLLGYGAPRPSEILLAGAPSIGTQGQVWIVMFSNGFVGLALFFTWLFVMLGGAIRTKSNDGVWLGAILLMGTFEGVYYGLIGSGLALMMVAGALAMRERNAHTSTVHRSHLRRLVRTT